MPAEVTSLCAFRARRSEAARAELARRGFPVDLLDVDRQLAAIDEALVTARAWLRRSRSNAARARAHTECEELMQELQRLERLRLKLAGPELALVKRELTDG